MIWTHTNSCELIKIERLTTPANPAAAGATAGAGDPLAHSNTNRLFPRTPPPFTPLHSHKMMCCSAFARSPPPPTAETRRWRHIKTSPTIRISIGEGFRNALLAGALSLGLFLAPPPPPLLAAEECHEEQRVDDAGAITNEGLVEEAWEVVNESFLDAGNHGWSPEGWLQKKDDLLSGRIQSRSKAHDIIRRMLASLHDPYTRFLSPSEFSKMARYDITGIGINLREVPDESGDVKLKVLGILLDGPAHSAGVRQGDELQSVNGIDVKGKSAFEVSSMLQGPTETFVNIEVRNGNCGQVQSYKIRRKLVARTPVFYRLEKGDKEETSVGYVHLKEFNALARKDLLTALKRLQESGVSCFIIDLRDNLGGLVQAGIEVAKLFLDKGNTVIYTVGRNPQVQNSVVADSTPQFNTPLIVLVNKRTASASEIVAAALHDNCRAVLVGERTYGKGLIQSVFELHDGSGVVVTVGEYVTPNQVDINKNGIEPDFSQIPDLREYENHLMQCKVQRST